MSHILFLIALDCPYRADALFTEHFLQIILGKQDYLRSKLREFIDNILARNGIDKTRVLTAAITLADMADYGAFNAVWDAWVVDGYEPARSVTGGQLAVPEYKIKISVTAAL